MAMSAVGNSNVLADQGLIVRISVMSSVLKHILLFECNNGWETRIVKRAGHLERLVLHLYEYHEERAWEGEGAGRQ